MLCVNLPLWEGNWLLKGDNQNKSGPNANNVGPGRACPSPGWPQGRVNIPFALHDSRVITQSPLGHYCVPFTNHTHLPRSDLSFSGIGQSTSDQLNVIKGDITFLAKVTGRSVKLYKNGKCQVFLGTENVKFTFTQLCSTAVLIHGI